MCSIRGAAKQNISTADVSTNVHPRLARQMVTETAALAIDETDG